MTIFNTPFYFASPHDEIASLNQSKPAYLFGADPTWHESENSLMYFNSLKMKLSVIMGVTQMVVGIVLSLLNAVHFHKPYNILFEFVPQMIFMLSTFGYMCFLIVLKWLINWPGGGAPATLAGNGPPSVLNIMINMFKSPGSVAPEFHLYPGQAEVQLILLLLALISVPIMLFVKPYLLKRDHERKMAQQLLEEKGYHTMQDEDEHHEEQKHGHDEHEEFDFGEEVVHQAIHTIEFVLGAVSNTASYLRLWALSLAHSQLSVVFLEMVLITVLEMDGLGYLQIVIIFIGFLVWGFLTFAVLLGMESLSAFLHALRLHWVEFQNKFYLGDGYKFMPFAYTAILSGEVQL
jgi:V-type H+-transporting ATPase subunit a